MGTAVSSVAANSGNGGSPATWAISTQEAPALAPQYPRDFSRERCAADDIHCDVIAPDMVEALLREQRGE